MSKHTPGPWIAKLYEPDENGIREWGVRQSPEAPSVSVDGEALACGFSICNIVGQDMGDIENGIERANAELIASAPTLQSRIEELEADLLESRKAHKLTVATLCDVVLKRGEDEKMIGRLEAELRELKREHHIERRKLRKDFMDIISLLTTKNARLEAEKAELRDILRRLDVWGQTSPTNVDGPRTCEPVSDILEDTRAALANTEPVEGRD